MVCSRIIWQTMHHKMLMRHALMHPSALHHVWGVFRPSRSGAPRPSVWTARSTGRAGVCTAVRGGHRGGHRRFSKVGTDGVVHAIEHRSSQSATKMPDELRLTTEMRIDNSYSDQVAGIHHGCLNTTFSLHFGSFQKWATELSNISVSAVAAKCEGELEAKARGFAKDSIQAGPASFPKPKKRAGPPQGHITRRRRILLG